MRKLFLTLTCLVFAGANIFAANEVVDQTLAVVNSEPIFTSEFNAIVIPMIEQYRQSVPPAELTDARINELKNVVLNQKIEDVLIRQEAKKQKIKISKKELEDQVAQIKGRFATADDFNAELKKENLTAADFEKRINDQMAAVKLVRQSVDAKVKPVTEEQAKAFYDKVVIKMKGGETGLAKEEDDLAANLANFLKRMSGEQVKIRQIFVACPKDAAAADVKAAQGRVANVKKALATSESFAAIATRLSEDAASREKGGDIGIVVKGDLPKEIDKAVFSLSVGDYTKEPIKTDNGYHFLRVEEKRASKDYTFDEVKNDIAQLLYQNEVRKSYAAWVADLKSKSDIKINKTW